MGLPRLEITILAAYAIRCYDATMWLRVFFIISQGQLLTNGSDFTEVVGTYERTIDRHEHESCAAVPVRTDTDDAKRIPAVESNDAVNLRSILTGGC